jgi:hypothetical protein
MRCRQAAEQPRRRRAQRARIAGIAPKHPPDIDQECFQHGRIDIDADRPQPALRPPIPRPLMRRIRSPAISRRRRHGLPLRFRRSVGLP